MPAINETFTPAKAIHEQLPLRVVHRFTKQEGVAFSTYEVDGLRFYRVWFDDETPNQNIKALLDSEFTIPYAQDTTLPTSRQERELDFAILSLAQVALHHTMPADEAGKEAWHADNFDIDRRISDRRLELNEASIDEGFGDLYEQDNGPLARVLALLGKVSSFDEAVS